MIVAVAVGGAVGALARHATTSLLPAEPGSFGAGVLMVNVVGCALLGMLTAGPLPHRLARPFLGVGVLGGFTTFSAFALDASTLADTGERVVALAYVGATVLGCLLAALAGLRLGARR